jgi:hypothetical protein
MLKKVSCEVFFHIEYLHVFEITILQQVKLTGRCMKLAGSGLITKNKLL